MIENDWDEIRKEAFRLVRKYRENENLKTWEEKIDQEKRARINVEIDRMIKNVKNPDSPLNSYVGRVKDEILAVCIADMITTPFKDRKFISQLGFEGMRYDYTDLLGNPDSAEKYTESVEIEKNKKTVLDLYNKTQDFFKPERRIDEILKYAKQIRRKDEDSVKAFERIKECVSIIEMGLKVEKVLAAYNNMESVYSDRVASYIKVTEVVIEEVLYSVIIKFAGHNQFKYLKTILQGLAQIDDEMQKIYCEEEKKPVQELIVNQNGKKSTPAMQYLTLRMQYKVYNDEATMIENLLEDDIEKNKDFFLNPRAVKHFLIRQYSDRLPLIKDLKERESVSSDDYTKLGNAIEYIERYEGMPNSEYTITLRIIYRELFMNKAKLQDKGRKNHTAATITKKLIGGKEIENREWIFIEKKIQRGTFRELQILSEYKYFNKINQIYRGMMGKIFAFSNDELMYGKIADITIKTLKLIENNVWL